MLQAGERAPSFSLADTRDGREVSDPWLEGDVVLAFFKVTCPVCQMVAPKVDALARAGARVVAIGEDPPAPLVDYASRYGQLVPTVSEPPPYDVSRAFALEAVPTLFLVGADGLVRQAVGGWDRERWNQLARAAGAGPVSEEGDGLPVFRPG